jgi:hypothetical protein
MNEIKGFKKNILLNLDVFLRNHTISSYVIFHPCNWMFSVPVPFLKHHFINVKGKVFPLQAQQTLGDPEG